MFSPLANATTMQQICGCLSDEVNSICAVSITYMYVILFEPPFPGIFNLFVCKDNAATLKV